MAAEAVAAAGVEAYPRIVAALIRVTRDWALAEDCAQEALTVALERWPADGEPAFADEAVRLARLLDRLMPEQSEVAALLALFLFQYSRRDARRAAAGNLLPLDRQDRRRWDQAATAEGLAALDRVRHDGPYAWQARIAACHARVTGHAPPPCFGRPRQR